jgi:hypothetical protein
VKDGFCTVYHPTDAQDMRELGRRGGSCSPLTKLRKAADDDLREQARETLSRALAGEEVPKPALDEARSLFAYRPTEAPRQNEREVQFTSRSTFSIQQLIDQAAEVQLFSQSGWLDAATEAQMLENVRVSRARKQGEEMDTTARHPPSKKTSVARGLGAYGCGRSSIRRSAPTACSAASVFPEAIA